MKFFLMMAVNLGDVLTLLTTPFFFIIFWPINVLWCVAALTTDILFATSTMQSIGYPIKLTFYTAIVKYLGYNDLIV